MTRKINRRIRSARAHTDSVERDKYRERKNESKNIQMKKRNTHKQKCELRKKGMSQYLFPRFYSSTSQLFGTSKAIHIFILDRQTDRHAHILYMRAYRVSIHTPFSVHLVSNQTLDEGLVTIETFVKVLHPKNIQSIVHLSILLFGLVSSSSTARVIVPFFI